MNFRSVRGLWGKVLFGLLLFLGASAPAQAVEMIWVNGSVEILYQKDLQYFEAGAMVVDEDGNEIADAQVSGDTVDTSISGDYIVEYTYPGAVSNFRKVTVVDTLPPLSQLLPPTIGGGSFKTDLLLGDVFDPKEGVTCFDTEDGDITDPAFIAIPSSIGPYTSPQVIQYVLECTDSVGIKTQLPRIVTFSAPTYTPEITLAGPLTEDILAGFGSYTEYGGTRVDGTGATCNFPADGDCGVQITGVSAINTSTPGGPYTVTYQFPGATDQERLIQVVDRNPNPPAGPQGVPVITLNEPILQFVAVGSPYNLATDDPGGVLTAADGTVLNWSNVVRTGAVNTTVENVYTLRYNYSDANGAAQEKKRWISVYTGPVPNDPPWIVGPNSLEYQAGATVNKTDVLSVLTCRDNDDQGDTPPGFPAMDIVAPATWPITMPAAGLTMDVDVECLDDRGDEFGKKVRLVSLGLPSCSIVGSCKQSCDPTTENQTAGYACAGTDVCCMVKANPAPPAPTIPPQGLTVCGNKGQDPCEFCHFLALGNTVLNWLIGILFVLFGVLMAVAGWGLVTSGGNPSALQAAKDKFVNALIGLIVVLVAWLLIDTVMRMLLTGPDGSVQLGTKNFGPWAKVECVGQPTPQDNGGTRQPPADPEIADECANSEFDKLKDRYGGSTPGLVDPLVQEMINCFLSADPNIRSLVDANQLYTVDRSYPVCAATNGNPVCSDCSHSVNSCHYGRGSGKGAQAVDFNAIGGREQELYDLLKPHAAACKARLNYEDNHTHASIESCGR